jgi:hypothetical protein
VAPCAGSAAGVETWLRGLCGTAVRWPVLTAADSGGRPAAPGLAAGDLGTALVGQSYVLGETVHSAGLERGLTRAYGEETGLALLHPAMHQAVRGQPL